MSVFVSASDESSGADHLCDFQCSGFVAPEADWSQFFAPAWQERVLNGPPKIEYLHVTEMRSRSWREKNGVTEIDAEKRLDEAASIIDTMGSLYPVKIRVNGPVFRRLYAPHQIVVASGAHKRYEPDYYAFIYYVYVVLARITIRHPDAEKVNFVVEQKSTITTHIRELYESMPDALRHIDRSDLIPLLGEFIPGTKERIPLQAADFLCWHSQRADAGTLEEADVRRWNPLAKKLGFSFDVPEKLMKQLAEAFDEHGTQDGAPRRIREVRRHTEEAAKRPARGKKGKTRSGKGSKEAED